MTSEAAFIVRCGSCHPHGSSRPLEVRETCSSCAEDIAEAHRSRGCTHVKILTTTATLQQRLHDPRTQRILRKVGW